MFPFDLYTEMYYNYIYLTLGMFRVNLGYDAPTIYMWGM